MSCPVGKEWDDFVAGLKAVNSNLTLADALAAYDVYNAENGTEGIIPTVDNAMKIQELGLEKDEQISRMNLTGKITQFKKQSDLLFDIQEAFASNKQKETLENLIKMTNEYVKVLEEDNENLAKGLQVEKAISVSKFIGVSDFKGDPLEYESFKLFGLYVHKILEDLQMDALAQNNTSVSNIFDRTYFNKSLKEYQDKTPFEIKGLDDDKLFKMTSDIIEHLSILKRKNYLIIPEISIFGTDSHGSKIIGRVDMLLIDPTGAVKIYDFKTKKLSLLDTIGNWDEDNAESALQYLALKSYGMAKTSDQPYGTQGAFVDGQFRRRSTYDTWAMQINIYKNILFQNNINVNGHNILSLLYETDKNKNFVGSLIHEFELENYYLYAYADSSLDKDGVSIVEKMNLGDRIKNIKELVDEHIPTKTKIEDVKIKETTVFDDIEPTEEEYSKMRENIKTFIDNEIVYAYSERSKEKTPVGVKNILTNRIEKLREYKDTLSKMDNDSFNKSANFAKVLDYLHEEMSLLNNNALDLVKKLNTTPDKFNNRDQQKMHVILKSSQSLYDIINVVQRVINEARDNEDNNINENNPMVIRMSTLLAHKESIKISSSKINKKNISKVLMTPGAKAFARINEQTKELFEKELEILDQEIKDLESGKGLSFIQTVTSKVLQAMSKTYNEKLDTKLGKNLTEEEKAKAPKLTLIEEKQKQISIIRKILNGAFDYTEEGVLAYIENITDPDSTFYIGSDRVFPYTQLISSSKLNDWIAGTSNKDLAISSGTQFLKRAAAIAVDNAQNHLASSDFDRLREELYRSGRSWEKINNDITEKRIIRYRDSITNEVVEKQITSLVKPYTQEYEDQWNSYKITLRQFDYEINQLKREKNQIYKDKQDPTEILDKLKNKISDRNQSVKDYNKWMVENCSLPYIDSFYELQRELPTEIAEQLIDKYLEVETYRYFQDSKFASQNLNKEGELIDVMTDFDFERIGEIEDEIRVLRQKAKDISPEYADYISKMNEYFDFDIDYLHFKRQEAQAISKYEGNAEGLAEWYKDNQVTRPTGDKIVNGELVKGWYTVLGELYEELSFIYGEDLQLKDLLEQRSKLLRPHRVAGVLKPQYLSQDELDRYDEIQRAINEHIDSSPKTQLDDFSRETANEILSKINSIKEKRISDEYKKEFDTRTKHLRAKRKLVTDTETHLILLKNRNSDKEVIEKETKQLEKLTEAFYKTENEYKIWYNRNHIENYKSITTGYKLESFNEVNAKEFNFVVVPAKGVEEQYMETIPHPKYNKRTIKKDKYEIDGVVLNPEEVEDLTYDLKTKDELLANGRLVITKGVENPNFLKSPDGIPMPKNIIKLDNNVYVPNPNMSLKNINTKYLDLYKDDKMFDFYKAISTMFFDLQKRTDGKVLGYTIPGSVAGFTETLFSQGLGKAIEKSKDKFIDKHIKAYGSAQDINDNTFGDLGNAIRLKGNNQLSDLLQSHDSVSAIMEWCAEAHYNIAMQEASPVINSFIDELKSKETELQEKIEKGDKGITRDIDGKIINSIDFNKRKNEIQAVREHLEYERNKFISGQYEDPYAASRAVTKKINAFFRYTSFIRIAFDVTNQTKNYVAGTIQELMAACDFDSGQYNSKDFLWAKAHVFGKVLPSYFKDLGSISDVSETTMIYRLFNPVQKEFGKYVKDLSGKKSRKVLSKMLNVNELGFFLQDKGDSLIGMTVLWSVLNNNKYRVISEYDQEGNAIYQKDKDGNDILIPAHECYIKNSSNQLVIRSDVDYTKDDENFLRNIVYSEMRRAQGNYAKADQVKAEAGVMGKMMLFFRKYMIPMFQNRFGYMRTNWEAGEIAVGYWRALGIAWRQYGGLQVAKHMLIGGKTLNRLNANTMGKFLTGKVNHARRDALAMLTLTFISMMLLAYVKRHDEDDDEDKGLGIIQGNAIRLFWQVKGETNSMFPVGEGSTEYIRNFTTGIPFVREFTAGIKTLNHGYSLGAALAANNGAEPDPDSDSQWYQETWKNAYYNRNAGSYEKGDAKIIKDMVDLTGIRNIRDLLQPDNRIDILKRNQ